MTHIWPKITQFDTFISSFSPLSTRLFSLTHNSLSQSEQVYTGFIASLASQTLSCCSSEVTYMHVYMCFMDLEREFDPC